MAYEGEGMALIVSGIGKVAAAAATAFLHAITGKGGDRGWINAGLAGHASHPAGYGVLAHKITDHSTGESWYPQRRLDLPCDTGEVLTVGRPEKDFQGSWVYEMEASGFYATACRFSTSELVHCYKVISDNPDVPAAQLTPSGVEKLMQEHLGVLDALVNGVASQVQELASREADPPEMERYLSRWRFTVTQCHQLRRLLRRWRTLSPGRPAWPDGLEKLTRARDVLACLKARIDSDSSAGRVPTEG
ncbi:MAG: hypothetical protein HYU36_09365 [Planctomycetes bacterium]|nr:hypothetical protein [Planctomycetota bacterium]